MYPAYRLTVVKFETKKKQIKQTVSSKILPFLREEKSIDTQKKKNTKTTTSEEIK